MIALAIHFFLIGVFVFSAIVITDAIEEGIARWRELGDD